jgi:hypothetical protein
MREGEVLCLVSSSGSNASYVHDTHTLTLEINGKQAATLVNELQTEDFPRE